MSIFILIPLLCAVNDIRPPCTWIVHFIPNSLFSLISSLTLSNHLSSLWPSSLPPPLYSHSHHPSSYTMLLSSHHMPITHPTSFSGFSFIFPNYSCSPYSFISYPVKHFNSADSTYHSYFCNLHFIFLCLLQFPCICPTLQCH